MKRSTNLENKNFFNLEGYQITPEGGRASYFYIAEVIANYCWQKHQFLSLNTLTILQYKNNEWHLYYAVKDRDHFKKILKRFISNPSLLLKMENYMTKVRESAVKHIINQPLKNLSDKKLGNLLAFFYLQLQQLHISGMMVRLIDRGVLEYLKNYFAFHQQDDKSDILSSSSRQTFSTQEKISLLKLAIKIKKKPIKLKSNTYTKELKKVYDNFCWSTMGYYDEPAQTFVDYKKNLKLLISHKSDIILQEIRLQALKIQNERRKILKKGSKELKIVSDIASEASYLKDYFKYSTNKVQYYAESIFEEISQRRKVKISDLKNLSHQDAVDLIVNGLDSRKTDKSDYQRHTVFVSLTGKIRKRYIGIYGDEYENLFLMPSKNISNLLKGRPACRGIVLGIAKVVRSPKDFYKVERGNILIVMNTSPDFVPILSKVGAIVAEEGGITAHVSVISREMKVPCVVGIPHVTKMINDGDYLEINANTGVVRILKKA